MSPNSAHQNPDGADIAATQTKSSGKSLLTAEHLKIGYRVGGDLHVAVGDVSFEVWPNDKVMLIGPSGCGKSTLLKTIAGFMEPVSGEISIAGRDSLELGLDRTVVFQEFDQLFPWRTVVDNVVPASGRGSTQGLGCRHCEAVSRNDQTLRSRACS